MTVHISVRLAFNPTHLMSLPSYRHLVQARFVAAVYPVTRFASRTDTSYHNGAAAVTVIGQESLQTPWFWNKRNGRRCDQ
jgi:hypothetical protein